MGEESQCQGRAAVGVGEEDAGVGEGAAKVGRGGRQGAGSCCRCGRRHHKGRERGCCDRRVCCRQLGMELAAYTMERIIQLPFMGRSTHGMEKRVHAMERNRVGTQLEGRKMHHWERRTVARSQLIITDSFFPGYKGKFPVMH